MNSKKTQDIRSYVSTAEGGGAGVVCCVLKKERVMKHGCKRRSRTENLNMCETKHAES